MAEKLWAGRFEEKTDALVEAFTSSIAVDRRLYVHDIRGSVAHCRTLARAGIIGEQEADALIGGLEAIEKEIAEGTLPFTDALEDIHTHIENRLAERLGPVARKLHTGRSRNDQVATDVRLYLKEETRNVVGRLVGLRQALVDLARTHLGVVMPGYTHLQRAQPVLLSHHLLAYFEMFSRDVERFRDALRRIDVLPLGSAALAGTTYPIDREHTARLLGFSEVSRNSIDAVSDRDFILEWLGAASVCMVHLSRLSEEIILWSSAEFGFVLLPDAFATGSSIMPQKKNPDAAELVRGKTGRVFGSLLTLLTIMKSLPLAYNRDMQEDKPPLFDAVDTLKACLEVYTRMLPQLTFDTGRMLTAAETGFLNATDMADYLVEKGLAFREAHGCVGRAVRFAQQHGKELEELSLDTLKSFSPVVGQDIFQYLDVRRGVDRRRSTGGTALENVSAAVKEAGERLDRESKWA